MPSQARLTILMKVYNEERHLETALQSLLNQSYTHYQFIITDNGSTDGTAAIIDRFARQDPRITVITNKHNIPPRYTDLEIITTPYFLPVAGHDYYLPQYVEKCMARLEADPRVVLAYSKTMFMKGDRVFGPVPTVFETMEMAPVNRAVFVAVGLIESYQQFGIFKTDTFKKASGYGGVALDVVMLTSLAVLGMFALVDEPLFYLRQADDWGNGAVYRKKHFPDEVNGVTPFAGMLDAFVKVADQFDASERSLARLALFSGSFLRHKWVLEIFGESAASFFKLPAYQELSGCLERMDRIFDRGLLAHYTGQGAGPPVEKVPSPKAPAIPAPGADQLCACGSRLPFKQCHGDLAWNRLLDSSLAGCAANGSLLHQALACAKRGNLPLADLLVRSHLVHEARDVDAVVLLGEISLKMNLLRVASNCFTRAVALLVGQGGEPARLSALEETAKLVSSYLMEPAAGKAAAPRYLLIKAWGYGFWSDIDHVIGQLLLAEITGRIPVVHWGGNSLFGDAASPNAFDLYFEPVSQFSLADLAAGGLSYYPPKWHSGNLSQEENGKWAGPYCRQSSIQLMGRDEAVVVSDFHTPIAHLLPWIPADSAFAAMKWHEIYRHLYSKYLRLKPHLAESVEAFYARNMAGQRWLAVHVRGSDKITEQRDLLEVNRESHRIIDGYLQRDPELRIFLMTDSSIFLEEFQEKFGARVLSTDTIRTAGSQGVHYQGHSGKEVGESVVFDCYLASKCDYFLGNGGSNVSATVGSLKLWDEGNYNLIGRDLRSNLNISIHNW